jgi:hypothetical protein
MDDGFGYWLAGFFAGEGSVGVYPSTNRTGFRCSAKLSLRADDAPILREIVQRTGIGRLLADSKGRRTGAHPCIAWHVTTKADCLKLVRLFERYGLRAKKARDFAIWAAAVREWCRTSGRGVAARRGDWTVMEDLAAQLRRTREFDATFEPRLPAQGQEALL